MFVSIDEFKKGTFKEGVGVYKDFTLEEVNEVDDLTLEFVISTASVDRDEDTINPAGWKLDAFQKNPVVLFAHDYTSLPVATAVATWVEGDKLKSRAKFTPKELYPFGYMVYQMYKNGYMKATSVGFNPKKWRFSEDRKAGIDFEEQELLEWSCVPVPANPEALIAASAEGIDIKPLKAWAEKILEDIKGVITYNQAHRGGTPKAAESESWDGPAEMAAATVDDLRVMCAWVDSNNPDIKGSYKLPHHKAGGDHAVVWRGVAAAMNALLGGRGGVNIPDSDRRGVYNHLAQHYREFDKEAPEFTEFITEETKASIEETKAGAVLNKNNKERLRQAQQLIQEVLDSAEPAEEESISEEEIKSMVSKAIKDALKEITGKID